MPSRSRLLWLRRLFNRPFRRLFRNHLSGISDRTGLRKTGWKNATEVVQTLKVLKVARFDSFAFMMVCKRIEHLQAKFRARIEWDNSFKDRLLELVRRIEVIWQPRVKKVLSSCSYKMVASPLTLWGGFLVSLNNSKNKGRKYSGKDKQEKSESKYKYRLLSW